MKTQVSLLLEKTVCENHFALLLLTVQLQLLSLI